MLYRLSTIKFNSVFTIDSGLNSKDNANHYH